MIEGDVAREFWRRVVEIHPERVKLRFEEELRPVAVALIRETGMRERAGVFVAEAAEVLIAEGLAGPPIGDDLWDRSRVPALPLFLRNLAAEGRRQSPSARTSHPWHPDLAFLASRKRLRNSDEWLLIDAWLKARGTGEDVATVRERSYEIFRDEKRLEEMLRHEPFAKGHISRSRLRVETACEPLTARFFPDVRTGLALVVENKDTFRSACVANARAEAFACVVFGEGGAASARMEDVPTLLAQVFFDTIVYFGDLDAEGFRIAMRTEAGVFEKVPGVGFEMAGPLYAVLAARPRAGCFGGTDDALAAFLSRHGLSHLAPRGVDEGRVPQEAVTREDMVDQFAQISSRRSMVRTD